MIVKYPVHIEHRGTAHTHNDIHTQTCTHHSRKSGGGGSINRTAEHLKAFINNNHTGGGGGGGGARGVGGGAKYKSGGWGGGRSPSRLAKYDTFGPDAKNLSTITRKGRTQASNGGDRPIPSIHPWLRACILTDSDIYVGSRKIMYAPLCTRAYSYTT